MPMCHGAGGVQAHHRFGARTGLAPVLLGGVLLVLGLAFAGSAAQLFALIPLARSAHCSWLPAAISPFPAACSTRNPRAGQ